MALPSASISVSRERTLRAVAESKIESAVFPTIELSGSPA